MQTIFALYSEVFKVAAGASRDGGKGIYCKTLTHEVDPAMWEADAKAYREGMVYGPYCLYPAPRQERRKGGEEA
jgi:hypothetical protein